MRPMLLQDLVRPRHSPDRRLELTKPLVLAGLIPSHRSYDLAGCNSGLSLPRERRLL